MPTDTLARARRVRLLTCDVDGVLTDGRIYVDQVTPPREIVMKLNGELAKALNGADIRKRFDDMGLVAKPSSPEEFGAFLQAEMTRWKAILAKKP